MSASTIPEAAAGIPAQTDLDAAGRAKINWWQIARVLLLVLAPCFCYWPALNGEFLWDDEVIINHSAQEGLRQIWFSTKSFDYYPLTNSFFWLQEHWWGDQTAGYHLFNLAWHVGGVFLLWRLLQALRLPGAWFAALVFAVHPINVASVAWIAELKNVLCLAFYLAAMLCFVRWRERPENTRIWSFYLASLGLYALAAFAKASVVMFPCLLLLIMWWQQRRLSVRDLACTVPFFAVSLMFGVLSIWFQSHRGMTIDQLAEAPPLLVRLLTAARAVWFYLAKVVFPHPLSMVYPRWSVRVDDPWAYLAPGGLVVVLAAGGWAWRSWGRPVLVVLGCFVCGILPITGLMHIGFFAHSNVSDHYAHLSVPVICGCVAALLGRWRKAGGRHGVAALTLMVAVAAALAVGCLRRAEDFRSSANLWSKALEVSPRSFTAHNNLGLALLARARHDQGQLPLAEEQFREALACENRLEIAGVNLGNALYQEGRYTDSVDVYRRVLAVAPDPSSYNNYGVALLAAGDNVQAGAAFREALRLDPALAGADYNLARIEKVDGHFTEADELLRSCLRLDPDHVPALNALVMLGVDSVPGRPPLSTAAAGAYVLFAERACQLTGGQDPHSLFSLAKALRAAGRLVEGDAVADRACDVATATGQTELAASLAAEQRPR